MKFTRLLAGALAAGVSAHSAPSKPASLSWQQWHMLEEHQMDEFDAGAFFALHDLDNTGFWKPQDILYIYGLSRASVVGDGSGMGEHEHVENIPRNLKQDVVASVQRLVGTDADGRVSRDGWLRFSAGGGVLPDFGVGPGHHFDFEEEYERHHWNKYHRDQDPDVHVKHKEDIEHEILHHEHEMEDSHMDSSGRRRAEAYDSPIRLENVPQKYRS